MRIDRRHDGVAPRKDALKCDLEVAADGDVFVIPKHVLSSEPFSERVIERRHCIIRVQSVAQ
jgi:hypothetical protein